jgi:hypothetical protein
VERATIIRPRRARMSRSSFASASTAITYVRSQRRQPDAHPRRPHATPSQVRRWPM